MAVGLLQPTWSAEVMWHHGAGPALSSKGCFGLKMLLEHFMVLSKSLPFLGPPFPFVKCYERTQGFLCVLLKQGVGFWVCREKLLGGLSSWNLPSFSAPKSLIHFFLG